MKGVDNHGRIFTSPACPEPNEIVTVHSYAEFFPDSIVLVEYYIVPPGHTEPQCYKERMFEPLADISELTELLKTETVEI